MDVFVDDGDDGEHAAAGGGGRIKMLAFECVRACVPQSGLMSVWINQSPGG